MYIYIFKLYKTELVETIGDLFGLFFLNYSKTMLKYVCIYL